MSNHLRPNSSQRSSRSASPSLREGTLLRRLAPHRAGALLLCGAACWSLGCDNKSLRDEVVFTRSSRPILAGGSEAPGTSVAGQDRDSPVPRTVSDLLGTASGTSSSAPPEGPGVVPSTSAEPDAPASDDDPDDSTSMGGATSTPATGGSQSIQPEPALGGEPAPSVEPEPAAPADPEPQPDPPAVRFSKAGLLASIAECTQGKVEAFIARAEALRDTALVHASEPNETTRLAAQQAWLFAMLEWEVLELFQFGPAAASSQPGGSGLRERIYSWNGNPPGSHRCRIETQLVERSYASSSFASSLVVARTLSAIEYLLFYQGAGTACTQFDPIVADGTFAALSPEELSQRKADYAAAAAEEVLSAARSLADRWNSFDTVLTSADADNAVFTSEQAALNAISDALFYLDKEAKDFKLGMPLGLVPECPRASCPEAFESQYAHVSTLLLHQNLLGFEALFAGCDKEASLGFDDWLISLGAESVAQRMQSALDNVRNTVATLDPPLEDALQLDANRVLAVHAALKQVTDLLKTEFVTVLNLELPQSSEGDND